jgi:SAM-dependent methyltransferase
MSDFIDEIVECMPVGNESFELQRVQTEHRVKLAQFWDIRNGSRILEIGCGQGDTTAVLAHFVGESGFVYGVDIASPNYGAPITVGDSAKFLMDSRLGKRIKMEYEIDVLSPEIEFPLKSFDTVVLSHCSWYMSSFEEFSALLTKIRKWGKQLFFAEWDSRITTIEQLPHLLAVFIQAQYECFKEDSSANVRTLFTPHDVKRLVKSAGWDMTRETTIIAPEIQDGSWEVSKTLADWQLELGGTKHMPSKLKSLIASQVHLLDDLVKNNGITPLSTFALVAQ